MANYCSNNIAFYSKDRTLLQDLFTKINDVLDNTNNHSIYQLILKHGYSEEAAKKITDCRDYITYAEDKITDCPCGYSYFKIDTESAWQPNMTTFFYLLQDKYANKISLVYTSEELGSGVFINTDVDGLFFNDRYKIDCCIDNNYFTDYFTDFNDVIEFIQEDYPKADVCIYDNPEEIRNKVITAYGSNNEDSFFYLDRFTCNYESRWN